jgi:acetyl esterase/lipase
MECKRVELVWNATIGEKGKIALTLPDGGPNRSAPGWTVPFVVAIHGNDAPPESLAFEPNKQRMVGSSLRAARQRQPRLTLTLRSFPFGRCVPRRGGRTLTAFPLAPQVRTGRVARGGADYRFAAPNTGPWHDGDIHAHDWFWPRLSAELGEIALVQVSPRPAHEAVFPHPYDDLLSILRWLHAHAAEYHLDRERCVLIGASSGAHLAALVATRGTKDQRYLSARAQRQGSQPPDPLPNICGVVSYAGILDLLGLYDKGSSPSFSRYFTGPPALKKPLATLMSGALKVGHVDRTEMYKSASPLEHAHPDAPPMLLVHGVADELVPIAQSRAMAEALREAGGGQAPLLLEVAEAPHFAMNGDEPLPWEELQARRAKEEAGGDAETRAREPKQFVCEAELLEFLRKQLRVDELAAETPQDRARRVESELLAEEIKRQAEVEQRAAKLLMTAPGKPQIRLERTLMKK